MTRTISVGFLTGLVLLSVVAGTTTVAQERNAGEVNQADDPKREASGLEVGVTSAAQGTR